MTKYALHPEVFADLDEIAAPIGRDSTAAAIRVVDDIRHAIEGLAAVPERGLRRPNLTNRPQRFNTRFGGSLTGRSGARSIQAATLLQSASPGHAL